MYNWIFALMSAWTFFFFWREYPYRRGGEWLMLALLAFSCLLNLSVWIAHITR
jgi:hypothetical protein